VHRFEFFEDNAKRHFVRTAWAFIGAATADEVVFESNEVDNSRIRSIRPVGSLPAVADIKDGLFKVDPVFKLRHAESQRQQRCFLRRWGFTGSSAEWLNCLRSITRRIY